MLQYFKIFVLLISLISLGSCEKTLDFEEKTMFDLFGGRNDDGAVDIIKLSDGGYVVAGNTMSYDQNMNETTGYSESNYWVLKFDATGNAEWQRSLGGSKLDQVVQVIEDNNGDLIIVGNTDGDVEGFHGRYYSDIWVVKLNKSGDIIAQKCLGGTEPELVSSISPTTDGGYIISGSTMSYNGDVDSLHYNNYYLYDAWIIKLYSNLNIEWEKCLGGTKEDYGCFAIENSNGNYSILALAGSNNGNIDNSGIYISTTTLWFIELNNIGEIVRQKLYLNMNYSFIFSCASNSNNEIIGFANKSDNEQYWWEYNYYFDYEPMYCSNTQLFKISENGEVLWVKNDWSRKFIYINDIKPANDYDFVIVGQVEDSKNDKEMWVFKIDQLGNQVWEEFLGGEFDDYVYSIVHTGEEKYLITGKTEHKHSIFDGSEDMFIYELVKN